jgi:hypothetical protein
VIPSRKSFSFAVIVAVFAFMPYRVTAQYEGAEPVAEVVKKGFTDIDPEQCKKWLSILASDEFEGRGSGQPGYFKAAEFMAERFKEFGLKPIGENGTYFQMVPFTRTGIDLEQTTLTIDGKKESFKIGVDYTLTSRRMTGDFNLGGVPIFVAASGAEAGVADPSMLKDRVVILSTARAGSRPRIRAQISRAQPSVLLEIKDKVGAPRAGVEYSGEGGRAPRAGNAPTRIDGYLTREAATRLATALGVDPKFTKANEEKDEILVEVAEGKKITVKGSIKVEKIGVPNVIGMIEGSDPKLKAENVIMGSHLDHIGVSPDGEINNGADDDGSGSTALLAVARAFSVNETKPKRSVIFIAVCGEEMGLLGSNWYVEHPIVPLESTVCELQMDMVGRNEEHHPSENATNETAEENIDTLHLIGSDKLSSELKEIILDLNKHLKFKFEYDQEGVYTRSDHYNFARKGIPISFFFSGFHLDYHQPTDEVSKINFRKIANTAKLVFLTAFRVADQEKRIVVDKKKKSK